MLALLGGNRTVTIPGPHEKWPPPADGAELTDLSRQRNADILIRGRAGPILEFEELFLDFLNREVPHAVTFNSGTSALLAAYVGIGIKPGDEVIGPALTYHAALSPLFVLGASPVLVDIDKHTRCIDPGSIEATITTRTKAITVVHQWGHPADMDQILEIARRHRLKVIEDCSHAHGSKYKGRLCGTLGDVAVFSLQTNKAMFAGEGGILVTSDDEVYSRATLLGHYRDRSRSELTNSLYQQYWVTGFGLKLRMSPFNAIVAKHSLRHFEARMEERHNCLRYFGQQLSLTTSYIDVPPTAPYAYMGAWYGFKPLLLPGRLLGLDRSHMLRALQAEGVEVSAPSGSVLSDEPIYATATSPVFNSLSKHPNNADGLENATHVSNWALSLPTFVDWQRDKPIIDQYVAAFKKVGNHLAELRTWSQANA